MAGSTIGYRSFSADPCAVLVRLDLLDPPSFARWNLNWSDIAYSNSATKQIMWGQFTGDRGLAGQFHSKIG
jgi:hypothetical protein